MIFFVLLIVSGILAAAAFFLAGFYLRFPSLPIPNPASKSPVPPTVFLPSPGEWERIVAERDRALEEIKLAQAQQRLFAERLRIAENENRAAFEREEKTAAAWEEQWTRARAERQQHELTLQREVEKLRAQVSTQIAEHQHLIDECQTTKAKEAEVRKALDALAVERTNQTSDPSSESERERLTQALKIAEAQAQDTLERLFQSESTWQAQAAALEKTLSTTQTALQTEVEQLSKQLSITTTECQNLREQNHTLVLTLHTAQDALAEARSLAQNATEAQKNAEARLADRERLAQENALLREEKAQALHEAKWFAGRENEVKDAKVDLAAAQAKLAEMDQLLEENRKLRDEVAELRPHQDDKNALEALTIEHKRLRLDAELMARRVQELQQIEDQVTSLRTQATEAASLLEEVQFLRRREKDLEAQIFATSLREHPDLPTTHSDPAQHSTLTDMESSLRSLVAVDGPRTSVLADAQGFLIAGVGESTTQEGLAAFAAVAGDMISRARMLLPIAEGKAVRVTDKNQMVLTCHLFESDGQGLGLCTIGPGEPSPLPTSQALFDLAAIMAPIPSNEVGE
jgi:hypothetical protein